MTKVLLLSAFICSLSLITQASVKQQLTPQSVEAQIQSPQLKYDFFDKVSSKDYEFNSNLRGMYAFKIYFPSFSFSIGMKSSADALDKVDTDNNQILASQGNSIAFEVPINNFLFEAVYQKIQGFNVYKYNSLDSIESVQQVSSITYQNHSIHLSMAHDKQTRFVKRVSDFKNKKVLNGLISAVSFTKISFDPNQEFIEQKSKSKNLAYQLGYMYNRKWSHWALISNVLLGVGRSLNQLTQDYFSTGNLKVKLAGIYHYTHHHLGLEISANSIMDIDSMDDTKKVFSAARANFFYQYQF